MAPLTSLSNSALSATSLLPLDPVSSSLAQSVMSMASSQSQHSEISTDTMSSMSGSYVAPGTEEDGDMAASPAVVSEVPSEGDVSRSNSRPIKGRAAAEAAIQGDEKSSP